MLQGHWFRKGLSNIARKYEKMSKIHFLLGGLNKGEEGGIQFSQQEVSPFSIRSCNILGLRYYYLHSIKPSHAVMIVQHTTLYAFLVL